MLHCNQIATSMLVSVLTLLGSATGQAAVTVSESFDYPTGDLAGANGGVGWSGGWAVGSNTTPTYSVIAPDLTPPNGYGTPIGNQAFIDPGAANDDSGGATPDIRRSFSDAIDLDSSQTLYFSMLVRREDVTNGGGTEHSSYLRLNAPGANVLGIGHESNEDFRIYFGGPGNNAVSSTTNWEIGVDYLVIAKLVTNPSGTDDVLTASLFKQGDSIVEPITWDLQVTGDLDDNLTELQLAPQRRGGRAFIDEIRIGTTFADVAAVPEPATLLLIGIGGMMAVMRR